MRATRMSQRVGLAIAAAVGWKVQVQPLPARCVVIGAPHTTGWDLPLTLLMILTDDLNLRWVAKDTLFRGPFGRLLRALGGIPVNRRSRNNFVDQMIEDFRTYESLRLAIVPEGTRELAPYWKTGFYYIALGAEVPIALGYVDFPRKVVGIGPHFYPTGDIEADFAGIRAFYANLEGKFPDQQGPIIPKPPDSTEQ